MHNLSCLEICAGAGGQSLGLELAGFGHLAVVEIDQDACRTLRSNRPAWNVIQMDVRQFDSRVYRGAVDLLAGGVPCPPFSIAGKQLGAEDERDLFPQALRMVEECRPAAVMLENVRGLSTARFAGYRQQILDRFHGLGYETSWRVLAASDFGVPQLRPRFILVALKPEAFEHFTWPEPRGSAPTVGEVLADLMSSGGWSGAAAWARNADGIAPTLVGGSRRHGGPDLGPSRAREAWRKLHVNGKGVADSPPTQDDPLDALPKLTVEMAAAIQGFPPRWKFLGGKTARYRQVGNAFPPPVAQVVGIQVRRAVEASRSVPLGNVSRALRSWNALRSASAVGP
jgi:DNA (cytosine-5)-methyltransferase 1